MGTKITQRTTPPMASHQSIGTTTGRQTFRIRTRTSELCEAQPRAHHELPAADPGGGSWYLGIWRRLRHVPYAVKFGMAEEKAAGEVAYLKDPTLAEVLEEEREGILNWIVEGARGWYADRLQPPPVVIEASRAYREKQDRLGAFTRERCGLDPHAREVLSALYNAYKDWCREGGIEHPLTRQRGCGQVTPRQLGAAARETGSAAAWCSHFSEQPCPGGYVLIWAVRSCCLTRSRPFAMTLRSGRHNRRRRNSFAPLRPPFSTAAALRLDGLALLSLARRLPTASRS
jgi:hypothetical protein